MTLSALPAYDSGRVAATGGRAIVVGASVAGLLAARVLADSFARVTVIDRDTFPSEPATRKGVPQGHQIHLLHEAGRATINDLLPGFGEELLGDGGLLLDYGADFIFYSAGAILADSVNHLPVYLASRPLYEAVIRRLTRRQDGIAVHPETQCIDYRLSESESRVTGVAVRQGGTRREMTADLVVDATGRTSRTPALLDANGYDPPPTDRVQIDLAYCTTYVERPPSARWAFYALPEAPRTRGALVHPIEGRRWVVTLIGMHGDHPPTNPEEFISFAGSLPVDEPARLLRERPWTNREIYKHPFPCHQRHRYEDLKTFPDGLVVIGDAITSFNPVYAQGMSVAALEALQLHHSLAAGDREELPRRFFNRAATIVDVAWDMAVGEDRKFEQTTGPTPQRSAILDRYTTRVNRAAHTDSRVAEAVHRVIRLETHPATLLRPGIAWRVLTPFA